MAKSRGLSDILIKNVVLPSKGKRLSIADEKLPGFELRVTANGVKTFVLRYRHRAVLRRLTLGVYSSAFTLAEARKKAAEALAVVRSGKDPALAQEEDHADESYHFENVVTLFVEKHCKVNNRPRTASETERLLRNNFVKVWKTRDIRDITKAQVQKILDGLLEAGSPSEANHAFVALRTMFNWCLGREIVQVSPVARMKMPAKTVSRDRVLSDDELRAVWRGFLSLGYPFGVMGQMLMLTGQRRGEVTELRWSHLDLDAKLWTIPKELAKNGREHVVPLTDDVLALLKDVERHESGRVFPARGNEINPISGFSKAKSQVLALSETQGWTYHDLRRTMSTNMGKLGILPHIVERLLNHADGELGGVAGIYNRYQYLPDMRAALETWNGYVRALMQPAESGVV